MTGKLRQVIFSSFIPEFHVIVQRVITSHCLVGIRRPGAQIEDIIIAFPKRFTKSQSDKSSGRYGRKSEHKKFSLFPGFLQKLELCIIFQSATPINELMSPL